MSERKLICLLWGYFFAIILFFGTYVYATPYQGDYCNLEQPDGSIVSVKVWGNEYYQNIESIDGYALIQDDYGWICYAELSDDGDELVATDIIYDGTTLPNAEWLDGRDSNPQGSELMTPFTLSAQEASAPTAYDQQVIVADSNGITIELMASDDGLPDPNVGLDFIITSLPEYGWLFEPANGREIMTLPHTLRNDSNSVIYKPCPYYFDGTDRFSFKVNDGGADPNSGDSNIADVNVVMYMLSEIDYGIQTTSNFYFPFFDGD